MQVGPHESEFARNNYPRDTNFSGISALEGLYPLAPRFRGYLLNSVVPLVVGHIDFLVLLWAGLRVSRDQSADLLSALSILSSSSPTRATRCHGSPLSLSVIIIASFLYKLDVTIKTKILSQVCGASSH